MIQIDDYAYFSHGLKLNHQVARRNQRQSLLRTILSPRYTKVNRGKLFQRYAELELAMILFTLGFSNDPSWERWTYPPIPAKKRHFFESVTFPNFTHFPLVSMVGSDVFLGETLEGYQKVILTDNSEVSTSSMALVFAEAAYSLFTTSVEAIWVGKRLKMMDFPSWIFGGWAPHLGDVVIGSIPHLFQPFFVRPFGRLSPQPGSLGDVPTITMVINHLHPGMDLRWLGCIQLPRMPLTRTAFGVSL